MTTVGVVSEHLQIMDVCVAGTIVVEPEIEPEIEPEGYYDGAYLMAFGCSQRHFTHTHHDECPAKFS